MIRRGHQTLLREPWNGIISPDTYHLLYSMARVQLLSRDLYPTHAACIERGNSGVLIVGHSGVGKTSILLQLLLQRQAAYYSGNNTVITFTNTNELYAVAGTPTITIKSKDKIRHESFSANGIEYGDRYAFVPDQSVRTSSPSLRITSIILPRLNDGVREFARISPLSSLHTLYPYMLDVVNADTILCNGTAVYSGTPSSGVQKKLAIQLPTALESIPVYTINGSLEFITQRIQQL